MAGDAAVHFVTSVLCCSVAAFLSVAGGTVADLFANDKVARYDSHKSLASTPTNLVMLAPWHATRSAPSSDQFWALRFQVSSIR
jgi:hypothetical protein